MVLEAGRVWFGVVVWVVGLWDVSWLWRRRGEVEGVGLLAPYANLIWRLINLLFSPWQQLIRGFFGKRKSDLWYCGMIHDDKDRNIWCLNLDWSCKVT